MPAALWCAIIGVLLVWVTVSGRDLWPFSAYPMFARPIDAEAEIVVFRLAVEQSDGSRRWWRTEDPTDQEEIGRSFANLFDTDPRSVLATRAGRQLLARVALLARHELAVVADAAAGADAAAAAAMAVVAVVVVRRSVTPGACVVAPISEHDVFRLPLVAERRLEGIVDGP
jgi:hypothetical protein